MPLSRSEQRSFVFGEKKREKEKNEKKQTNKKQKQKRVAFQQTWSTAAVLGPRDDNSHTPSIDNRDKPIVDVRVWIAPFLVFLSFFCSCFLFLLLLLFLFFFWFFLDITAMIDWALTIYYLSSSSPCSSSLFFLLFFFSPFKIYIIAGHTYSDFKKI